MRSPQLRPSLRSRPSLRARFLREGRPNAADKTFGMQVVYQKAPTEVNAPPTNGMQFFGQVDIDAKTKAMTVTLKDLSGSSLYSKTLAPQRS